MGCFLSLNVQNQTGQEIQLKWSSFNWIITQLSYNSNEKKRIAIRRKYVHLNPNECMQIKKYNNFI